MLRVDVQRLQRVLLAMTPQSRQGLAIAATLGVYDKGAAARAVDA